MHPDNLFNSFSAKMDMLIMSDRGHFLNIDTLNRILFSQLTRFGKLSFFDFRPSFLSPDAFRSIGCIGCKLIFLADGGSSKCVRIGPVVNISFNLSKAS